jgi:hypothetical protein
VNAGEVLRARTQLRKRPAYRFEAVHFGAREVLDISKGGLSDIRAHVEDNLYVLNPVSLIDVESHAGSVGKTVAIDTEACHPFDRLFGGPQNGKHDFSPL